MTDWHRLPRDSFLRRVGRRILRIGAVRIPLQTLSERLHGALLQRLATCIVFGTQPVPTARFMLIVSHELSATGAPKVLVEVIGACRQIGWQAVVIAPNDGPYREIFCNLGAFVIVSPTALETHSLTVEIGRNAVAVFCNTVIAVEVVRALLPHVPVAWYLHESVLIDAMIAKDATLPDVFRFTHALLAASDLAAAVVANHGGHATVLKGSSASLVGSRTEIPPMRSEGRALLAVLGSIESRKGHDLLLDALDLLPRETGQAFQIQMYGKPLEASFARNIFARAAASSQVSYVGAVTPDEAVVALLACDAIVIPSRDDPLPLVAVEALSAGRVVICSTQCGISAYLQHGVSGFVAADCSALALANILEEALARRDDWPMIGAAGRDVYEAHFTPELFRKQVIETIKAISRLHR